MQVIVWKETLIPKMTHHVCTAHSLGWLGGSVVERRSLIGELSLVCTGPAADR